MTNIQKTKIDFSLIFEVKKANANGDPLNGNLPRQNMEGNGEVSDVAIKRKIRNRWMQDGLRIYMQTADNTSDGFNNLKERIHGTAEVLPLLDKKGKLSKEQGEEVASALNEAYIDIRTFGAVIALKEEVSRGIRGAVSITHAESIDPVIVTSQQITKSVSLDAAKGVMGPDTMGSKHRIEYGLYRVNGSINAYLGEKNGLTKEDVELVKQALLTLFENDESTARPIGSMNIVNLYWWEHATKLGDASSHKVFESLVIESNTDEPTSLDNYTITVNEDGLPPVQVFNGF